MHRKAKGYRSKKHLKQFTLTATASAILALNTEAALAITCPAQITGTILAGVLCDFTGSSTVTVENNGEVGGIVMDSVPTPASQIVVNQGGLISNTTATAIHIVNSSLSNGIVNNGTISTNTISINVLGSQIGDITNNGLIESNAATGIQILSSTVMIGTLANNGSIISKSMNDPALLVRGNVTLVGDITNNGFIDAQGIGNGIHIDAQNTLSGNIINNGFIHAGGSGIYLHDSLLAGNLSNNGMITADQRHGISVTNQATVNGNINNSGSINAAQVGLRVRSNSQVSGQISNLGTIQGAMTGIAVTTSTSISGSLSNSGTIRGGVYAITVDNSSTLSSINIVGQTARIIGSVDAVQTDVNLTNGGIFTSEGTFNVKSFTVAPNALFTMAHSISAQNAVNNFGTLAVGETTQEIQSNYTQNTGGRFQTSVSSNKNYGQLVVTNTVDLSQSGAIDVKLTPDSSLHTGDVLNNVISGGTLITPTNGYNVTDNSYIWNFKANTNTTQGVNLTVSINPEVYEVCRGTYCQEAASAIINQIGAGNAVFNPYTLLSTVTAFTAAASQATPELTNEHIQMVQLITRAVEDVVPMWGSLHGQSAGDAMLDSSDKAWLKPYGATMTQNERNTLPGFQATAYGGVIGKDIKLSENWLSGAAFAVGGDNMHGHSVLNGQSIDSTAYQGMLYGAKKLPYHFYFASQGLVGYSNSDTKREIQLYNSTSKGSYDSWFTNVRGELGWSHYLLNSKFILTPEVEASYLFVNQGAYQEYGSLMDLNVFSNHNSSFNLAAYCNGAYHLTALNNHQDLTLTGYGGLAKDVINNQPQVLSTFVAGGPSFSTFGVQFNDLVFRGGAGLALSASNNPFALNLNYDLQVGNNAYSGVGAATIKYRA